MEQILVLRRKKFGRIDSRLQRTIFQYLVVQFYLLILLNSTLLFHNIIFLTKSEHETEQFVV
jgi:hypothetical protein